MEESSSTSVLLLLLIITTFFSISSSYTLDGQWNLDPQHLNYTSTDPKTTFAFKNKIVIPALQPPQDVFDGPSTNVVHKGTDQLIVEACKTLTYNYYISENTMYLQLVNSSAEVRPCFPN